MPRRPPSRTSSPPNPSKSNARLPLTPRAKLQLAARGEKEVAIDALTGLLADHLLAADGEACELAHHRGVLLEMITDNAKRQPPGNLLAALDAIGKIDNLERSSLSELRKTTELLWRMSAPTRPRVDVLEARPKPAKVSLGRS